MDTTELILHSSTKETSDVWGLCSGFICLNTCRWCTYIHAVFNVLTVILSICVLFIVLLCTCLIFEMTVTFCLDLFVSVMFTIQIKVANRVVTCTLKPLQISYIWKYLNEQIPAQSSAAHLCYRLNPHRLNLFRSQKAACQQTAEGLQVKYNCCT